MYLYVSNKATMRATKSEFECNWADKDGGAVYANDRCMCFVDNSSISFNKAASGPEAYIDNSSFLKIDNNISPFSILSSITIPFPLS